MSAVRVGVVVRVVAEPEHGLWCDDCLLPSVVRYPLAACHEDGRPAFRMPPADICTECGPRTAHGVGEPK